MSPKTLSFSVNSSSVAARRVTGRTFSVRVRTIQAVVVPIHTKTARKNSGDLAVRGKIQEGWYKPLIIPTMPQAAPRYGRFELVSQAAPNALWADYELG